MRRSCPTNSSSRRGRSERSSSSSSGRTLGREELLGLAHAALSAWRTRLFRRSLGIGRRERAVGLDDGVAELEERVARDEVGGAVRADLLEPELLLQLEHDALGGLLADARNRDEPGRVLEDDRAPQLGGRRAGDDQERDLRPDSGDRQQLLEELPLGRLGEAVELERVLAHVQIGVDRDLALASWPSAGRADVECRSR